MNRTGLFLCRAPLCFTVLRRSASRRIISSPWPIHSSPIRTVSNPCLSYRIRINALRCAALRFRLITRPIGTMPDHRRHIGMLCPICAKHFHLLSTHSHLLSLLYPRCSRRFRGTPFSSSPVPLYTFPKQVYTFPNLHISQALRGFAEPCPGSSPPISSKPARHDSQQRPSVPRRITS